MGYKLRVPYAGSTVQVNDILEKVRGGGWHFVANAVPRQERPFLMMMAVLVLVAVMVVIIICSCATRPGAILFGLMTPLCSRNAIPQ